MNRNPVCIRKKRKVSRKKAAGQILDYWKQTAKILLLRLKLMAMGVGFVEYVDREVRWAAAKALGQIGAAEAVPGLLHLLEDEDNGVRWAVIEALRDIGNQQKSAISVVGAPKPVECWAQALARSLETLAASVDPAHRSSSWRF